MQFRCFIRKDFNVVRETMSTYSKNLMKHRLKHKKKHNVSAKACVTHTITLMPQNMSIIDF